MEQEGFRSSRLPSMSRLRSEDDEERYRLYGQSSWSEVHAAAQGTNARETFCRHPKSKRKTEVRIIQRMEPKIQLDRKWIVLNRQKNPKTCILCLPGRGSHAGELCRIYSQHLYLNDHLIVGITPIQRYWYPMPNGVWDQEEAVAGQMYAIKIIEWVASYIEQNFSIPRSHIIMTGHSAGAVMAVLMAAYSQTAFAGVISHCGAILSPETFPICRHPSTNFLLTHCKDDFIFEWFERYVPMVNALRERGYAVWTAEENEGSHCITDRQIELSKYFVDACFKKITENSK